MKKEWLMFNSLNHKETKRTLLLARHTTVVRQGAHFFPPFFPPAFFFPAAFFFGAFLAAAFFALFGAAFFGAFFAAALAFAKR